jgi:alginate O-acetyltransferase complex protein AlgI
MLFNSFVFVGFFLLVYSAYLLARRNHRTQNAILLVASYSFYGSWDYRFLLLLAGSTMVDFMLARYIDCAANVRQRKLWLALVVTSNLTVLAVFKYFNFFASNAASLLLALGFKVDPIILNIILPVGISFYTFHEISYAVDVYRRRVPAWNSLVEYALFVAFFPLLVAGPIARASHLLPQLARSRQIRAQQVDAGLFLILWGYFKKVVIADNISVVADQVFNGFEHYRSLDLVIGALAFTVQIYGDFSGYSDIARGLAALMGFEISPNFKLPYFAVSPSDFWKRWHISLSTWLRDYLYVPLGGNRAGELATYRNLAITMFLGGLWHGAAWNFVIWGAFHGAILIAYRLASRSSTLTVLPHGGQVTIMFGLTVMGWVLFRARSAHQAFSMLVGMGIWPSHESLQLGYTLVYYSIPLVAADLAQYRMGDLLALCRLPTVWRGLVYGALLVGICVLGVRVSTEFIYFQF